MPVIKALRATLSDGNRTYPLFLGYLTAAELVEIAEVPSFTPSSEHFEIADNVLGDPVKHWQRPPIGDKVEKIQHRFSLASEIMPNPVLLAVNDQARVRVVRQVLDGQNTELFEIEVTVPSGGAPRPLWILDGQHRVLGLAQSAQRDNPVPLVLLHNDGATTYAPKQFAKIFAEVTTLATPLNPIHAEWLQFAFKLGPYSSETTADWQAMRAAADLCRMQEVGTPRVANPFFNKIVFNPEMRGGPAIGEGFEFTCTTVKELVRDNYYGAPSAGAALLTPAELGEEVACAVLALSRTDTTTRSKSAFFGDDNARQKYMEIGFVIGVLTYLRHNGRPDDWGDLLDNLGFANANWDFTGWVRTTGGNIGTLSKNIAKQTYKQVFSAGELPPNVSDVPTFLRGDQAEIHFRASEPTSAGGASRRGYTEHQFPISGIKKLDMGTRRHLKLMATSVNIGQLEVRELKNPLATEYSAQSLRRGMVMPSGGGRIELMIGAKLYGGTEQPPLTLEITWT